MPLTRPTTTPLPDEIYDEWAPQLGEAELKALLYIVRRTLGFRKDADAISLSQFMHGIVTRDGRVLDRGCGVRCRRHVVRALKGLEEKGLIRAEKGRTRAGGPAVTIYALRWEGDDALPTAVGGSVQRTPGSVPGTPGWCPSGSEVVSKGHRGSVPGTPTTNSVTTHRQQDSGTTGPPHDTAIVPIGSTDAAGLWRLVLDALRETMTAENYTMWLAGTVAQMDGNSHLTVQARTPTQRHWLDVRLRSRIESALARLGHGNVRLRVTVAS